MTPQVHATEEVACCLSSSTYLLCTTTPTNRPRAGRSSTIAPLMFGEWEESMTWMEHLASLGTVSYGPNCHSLIANIKKTFIFRRENAVAQTSKHDCSGGQMQRRGRSNTATPSGVRGGADELARCLRRPSAWRQQIRRAHVAPVSRHSETPWRVS
jgi:hypothetical protein